MTYSFRDRQTVRHNFTPQHLSAQSLQTLDLTFPAYLQLDSSIEINECQQKLCTSLLDFALGRTSEPRHNRDAWYPEASSNFWKWLELERLDKMRENLQIALVALHPTFSFGSYKRADYSRFLKTPRASQAWMLNRAKTNG